MALILTPSRLTHRSEFYFQLGSLVRAGVRLIDALETIQVNPPARSDAAFLSQVLLHLHNGNRFAESLQLVHHWLPDFDIVLIEAGEKTGRLDVCLKMLANHYAERARLTRSVLSSLFYPVGVVHLALLIFPTGALSEMVKSGNVFPFLLQKMIAFTLLDGLILICLALTREGHSPLARRRSEDFFNLIPFLGSARRELAIARLCAALHALISAGVGVVQSWKIAAAASGSFRLEEGVGSWLSAVEEGTPPGECLASDPVFPATFVSLYRTGEISGKMEDSLDRLYEYYHERGSRRLQEFARWLPRVIYGVVVICIAYNIVKFWMQYYGAALNSF